MSGAEPRSLAAAVEALPGHRALVVGDVMLDEYVWGDVSRASPEAPVPVIDVQARSDVPGGAANVARGIVDLGCSAALGGVVGRDDSGRRLRSALTACGVDCSGLLTASGRTTTTKTRVVARGKHVLRTDLEQREPLARPQEDELGAWGVAEIEQADVLVLSDYAKGVLSASLTRRLIDAARCREIPIVVDPKGASFAKYRGATVVTPNVRDLQCAVNQPVETPEDLVEVARRLERDVVPATYVLVTRGAEGMSLIRNGASADVEADARAVYDVTGAGDTVAATLATGLAAGIDVEEAMALANAAAGIAVEKVGTATVTLAELYGRIGRTHPA
jgi:rfaE bifunctional protein kinase chain/domain